MNVAILGAEQPSRIVANIIESQYNPWLEQEFHKVPMNVVAYVSGGALSHRF